MRQGSDLYPSIKTFIKDTGAGRLDIGYVDVFEAGYKNLGTFKIECRC
jgi:hypothetical protein